MRGVVQLQWILFNFVWVSVYLGADAGLTYTSERAAQLVAQLTGRVIEV